MSNPQAMLPIPRGPGHQRDNQGRLWEQCQRHSCLFKVPGKSFCFYANSPPYDFGSFVAVWLVDACFRFQIISILQTFMCFWLTMELNLICRSQIWWGQGNKLTLVSSPLISVDHQSRHWQDLHCKQGRRAAWHFHRHIYIVCTAGDWNFGHK